MRIRRELLRLILEIAQRDSLTDYDIANACRTSRPRASNLLHGHIARFNSETLIDILWRLGVTVDVTVVSRSPYHRWNIDSPRPGWRPIPGFAQGDAERSFKLEYGVNFKGTDVRSPLASASQIMLIRHAEKPPDAPPPHGVSAHGDHDGGSLTVRGWQRAGALVLLFTPGVAKALGHGLSVPNHLYCISHKHHSKRTRQTLTPLARKLEHLHQR